jgi:hypothetical protein
MMSGNLYARWAVCPLNKAGAYILKNDAATGILGIRDNDHKGDRS